MLSVSTVLRDIVRRSVFDGTDAEYEEMIKALEALVGEER